MSISNFRKLQLYVAYVKIQNKNLYFSNSKNPIIVVLLDTLLFLCRSHTIVLFLKTLHE
jgi:hypothetical protein